MPDLKDLAERLEEYHKTSSKTALLWASALVLVALTSFGPALAKYHAAAKKAEQKYEDWQDKVLRSAQNRAKFDQRARLEEDLLEATVLATPFGVDLSPAPVTPEKSTSSAEREAYIDAKREAEKPVPFKLPFDIEIPVPLVYSPTLFMLLAAGLLLFMSNSRYHAHRLLCSLAVRAQEQGASAKEVRALLVNPPLWLAPLPRRVRPELSALEPWAITGWPRVQFVWNAIIAMVALGLVGLQVWLCIEGLSLAKAMSVPLGTLAALACLNAIALTVSLWLVGRWLFDGLTRRELDLERPHGPQKLTRREFVMGLACFTGAVLLPGNMVSPKLSFLIHRKPRFKSKKKPKWAPRSGREGFYTNKKSGIVHSLQKGTLVGLTNPKVKLVHTSIPELPNPLVSEKHINRGWYRQATEYHALRLVEEKNYEKAMRLLWIGIYHDLASPSKLPNFRLYDLLARLASKYDHNELAQLIDLGTSFGKNSAFSARLGRWRKMAAHAKPHTIKWNGVVL